MKLMQPTRGNILDSLPQFAGSSTSSTIINVGEKTNNKNGDPIPSITINSSSPPVIYSSVKDSDFPDQIINAPHFSQRMNGDYAHHDDFHMQPFSNPFPKTYTDDSSGSSCAASEFTVELTHCTEDEDNVTSDVEIIVDSPAPITPHAEFPCDANTLGDTCKSEMNNANDPIHIIPYRFDFNPFHTPSSILTGKTSTFNFSSATLAATGDKICAPITGSSFTQKSASSLSEKDSTGEGRRPRRKRTRDEYVAKLKLPVDGIATRLRRNRGSTVTGASSPPRTNIPSTKVQPQSIVVPQPVATPAPKPTRGRGRPPSQQALSRLTAKERKLHSYYEERAAPIPECERPHISPPFMNLVLDHGQNAVDAELFVKTESDDIPKKILQQSLSAHENPHPTEGGDTVQVTGSPVSSESSFLATIDNKIKEARENLDTARGEIQRANLLYFDSKKNRGNELSTKSILTICPGSSLADVGKRTAGVQVPVTNVCDVNINYTLSEALAGCNIHPNNDSRDNVGSNDTNASNGENLSANSCNQVGDDNDPCKQIHNKESNDVHKELHTDMMISIDIGKNATASCNDPSRKPSPYRRKQLICSEWSAQQRAGFLAQYLSHGKNFKLISAKVKKPLKKVVEYYYLTKRDPEFRKAKVMRREALYKDEMIEKLDNFIRKHQKEADRILARRKQSTERRRGRPRKDKKKDDGREDKEQGED
ncbi:532_t:CDS:2 [Acaulospora morrowiae]|uniref:532_t:CDS:1 n=1 Tax=Acaulospora morrowiae TaxID=94023 RepID=A0A9N8W427_9GLOM|nr:532_t:CDS:2 [Acaulospora morrowiae]